MNEMQEFEVTESPSQEEQELQRKFFSEDEHEFGSALREIEEKYGSMIKGIWSRKGIRDPNVQDDLMQDLMLTLVQKRITFRGESKLTTWITKIAINICLTEIRSKKRRRTVNYDDSSRIDKIDSRKCLLSMIDTKDFFEYLLRKLQGRPEIASVIPLLIQKLSYNEMAERLNIPDGTVRSRISIARKLVKEILLQLRGESHQENETPLRIVGQWVA